MNKLTLLVMTSALWLGGIPMAISGDNTSCPTLLDYHFKPLAGDGSQHLCESYRGKLILVVNTASQCGYTGQYAGLEHLYDKFKEQGLVVIGFPSNDFGGQEPGSEQQIVKFCRDKYSIRFPLYQKVHAAKGLAHPFFDGLARQAKQYPNWNFHKYLIDRSGDVVGSWPSRIEPLSAKIVSRIKMYL